jgi:surface protein
MTAMFYGCSNLTSLDLSTFDTSSVTDMYGMFEGCSGLTSLDLSSFNTSNVTNMSGMFSGCINLININLSNSIVHSGIVREHIFCGRNDNLIFIVNDSVSKILYESWKDGNEASCPK